MKDLQPYLEKYAKLAVEVGINLKEKEGLVITTSTDGLPLSRLIAKEAYLSGAKHVELVLNDDEFALTRYQYGQDHVFEEYPSWKVTNTRDIYEDNYHHVFVISPNPELLKDADPEKVKTSQKVASQAVAPVMKYRMTGITKWVIVAVPSVGWAKTVFPDDTDEIA
ncbi:aminopeptidase, partial [Proteiniclasticum ruminis]|uniref:aminopeptidase n=1 Tax=Proteiniclasticum ruminis TaxID=398199 RepID=UPI00289BCA51